MFIYFMFYYLYIRYLVITPFHHHHYPSMERTQVTLPRSFPSIKVEDQEGVVA